MTPIEITGITVFLFVLFAGIFFTVLGLPGTVIIFIDVILYALFTSFDRIGFKILIILLLISLLAEALDFALGMAGAILYSTTKYTIWASLTGSLAGAIFLTPMLYGFGTILGIFLGGFAGVVLMELIHQSRLKPAFRAGMGTILGRFSGILAKGFLALIMVIITLNNIYS